MINMDYDIYVNGTKLPYVASYQVGWYDVSRDSGRDTTTADGTMILNVISQKFRLDITTKYLTGAELNTFYSQIKNAPTMTVSFYNPYTASRETKTMYRGDRTSQLRYTEGNSSMFEPITIALIQL
jgi:hypothetical protein